MINKEVYDKFLTIVSLFKNRPYHLAKYLIDNNALSEDFIKKLIGNKKLESAKLLPPHFSDINQMNKYFNSLLVDINIDDPNIENLSKRLNKKLSQLIKDELYEEAIQVRDYMIDRNIKRIIDNF